MAPKLTQTEARDAIVSPLVAKWDPSYALVGQHSTTVDDARFTIVDMESAIREAVTEIQNRLAPKLDQFANTLWSNENGGTAGTISKLSTDAHALIAVADEIVGTYRN